MLCSKTRTTEKTWNLYKPPHFVRGALPLGLFLKAAPLFFLMRFGNTVRGGPVGRGPSNPPAHIPLSSRRDPRTLCCLLNPREAPVAPQLQCNPPCPVPLVLPRLQGYLPLHPEPVAHKLQLGTPKVGGSPCPGLTPAPHHCPPGVKKPRTPQREPRGKQVTPATRLGGRGRGQILGPLKLGPAPSTCLASP